MHVCNQLNLYWKFWQFAFRSGFENIVPSDPHDAEYELGMT